MRNKGFTLLEMLISMSLLAILMTAIGGVLFQTVDDHSSQSLEDVETTYYTFLKIEDDIENYHSNFKGDREGFSFLRTYNQSALRPEDTFKGSGLQLLSYQFETIDGELKFTRTAKDHLVNLFGKDPLKVELLDVTDYKITYLDKNKKTVDDWKTADTPIAIRIEIFNDETKWERLLPIISIKGAL